MGTATERLMKMMDRGDNVNVLAAAAVVEQLDRIANAVEALANAVVEDRVQVDSRAYDMGKP